MQFIKKTPIEKGWSGDKKFRAETTNGEVYLLRIIRKEKKEQAYRTFDNMKKCFALGISMPEPIEIYEQEDCIYSVESFIEGEDAENYLRKCNAKEAYRYGIESGKMLKKLHSLPAEENTPPWEEYFSRKIDRKLALYENCPLRYEKDTLFLRFIAENRHLIKNRPSSFQHGDYHTGNMMIGKNGQLFIIDFDRCDNGDPWEEFNRIVWCVAANPSFAAGMVDGYFGEDIPEEFWRLLALYIANNTLSSLPWAIPFGEEQINIMKKQADDVLFWYNDFKSFIPNWYRDAKNIL